MLNEIINKAINRYDFWKSKRNFHYKWLERNSGNSIGILVDLVQMPNVRFGDDLYIIDDTSSNDGFVKKLTSSGFKYLNNPKNYVPEVFDSVLYNEKYNVSVTLIPKKYFLLLQKSAEIGRSVSKDSSMEVFLVSYKVLKKTVDDDATNI